MAKQVIEQKILYIHPHKVQMIKCIKCLPKQNSTLFYEEEYKIQTLNNVYNPYIYHYISIYIYINIYIISYTFLDMWIGSSLYPITRTKSQSVEWKPINDRSYTLRRFWLRNSYITRTNMCVYICIWLVHLFELYMNLMKTIRKS